MFKLPFPFDVSVCVFVRVTLAGIFNSDIWINLYSHSRESL